MCLDNKVKHNNWITAKQKIKHKNPCQSRESNREPLAPSRMRYLWTTELTDTLAIAVKRFNFSTQWVDM